MDNFNNLSQNDEKTLRFLKFEHVKEHSLLSSVIYGPDYHVYLVLGGQADVSVEESEYTVTRGSLIFFYPDVVYRILTDGEFEFFRISFTSEDAGELLAHYGIDREHFVFSDLQGLIGFWDEAQKRAFEFDDAKISKSVLLYTLALISHSDDCAAHSKSKRLFDDIISYTNAHYRDADISVKKLSQIFFYTEKHITTVFKKNMGISFKKYICNQRMALAQALIKNGTVSVTEISRMCGYSDPLYFSKVFSKEYGISPRDAIKQNKEQGK